MPPQFFQAAFFNLIIVFNQIRLNKFSILLLSKQARGVFISSKKCIDFIFSIFYQGITIFYSKMTNCIYVCFLLFLYPFFLFCNCLNIIVMPFLNFLSRFFYLITYFNYVTLCQLKILCILWRYLFTIRTVIWILR